MNETLKRARALPIDRLVGSIMAEGVMGSAGRIDPVDEVLPVHELFTLPVMTRLLKGFLGNLSVLPGIGVGFVIAIVLGKVDLHGVTDAGWFTIVPPFRFGWPVFDARAAAALCAVMIVMMSFLVGTLSAVLLNLLFNGLGPSAKPAAQVAPAE